MTESDAEKAYVKLQQAQGCCDQPRGQLKLLEDELGARYEGDAEAQFPVWRFPDGSKLHGRAGRLGRLYVAPYVA